MRATARNKSEVWGVVGGESPAHQKTVLRIQQRQRSQGYAKGCGSAPAGAGLVLEAKAISGFSPGVLDASQLD